ncbi:hypothetical protein HK405_001750 [Cladochytrium tenue]|nr:hypothetical protein HK405_001750 [Cladochytrium tenue]
MSKARAPTAVAAVAATAGAATVFAVLALSRYRRAAAIRASAKSDLRLLATEPPAKAPGAAAAPNERAHAVVVGGSVSGLVAARVLLRYFDTVTVLEAEEIEVPDASGGDDAAARKACVRPVRKNVMQYESNHIVLPLALKLLDALFPGFVADCVALGARHSFLLHNYQTGVFGVTVPPMSLEDAKRLGPELDTVVSSRGLIEGAIRYRVFKHSGLLRADASGQQSRLRYRPGTVANGLVVEEGKVKGVHVFEKASKQSEFLKADIVVDASGRAAWGLKWMRSIGVDPSISTCDPKVKYTNYLFEDETPHDDPNHVSAIVPFVLVNPYRGFVTQRIEGGVVLANAAITSGAEIEFPSNRDEYLEFVEACKPQLADKPSAPAMGAVKLGKLLSTSKTVNIPSSKWIHYEKDWLNPEVKAKSVGVGSRFLTALLLWAGQRTTWSASRSKYMAAALLRGTSMMAGRSDMLSPYILWTLITCAKPKWIVSRNPGAKS